MISKELLSEILDRDVSPKKINKNYLEYTAFSGTVNNAINIYELANKCKEWLIHKNIDVFSGWREDEEESNRFYCWVDYEIDTEQFWADTEPEAIFKACEWILNKVNKDMVQ